MMNRLFSLSDKLISLFAKKLLKRLADQCLEIIDEEAHEALKSDDFLNIDHDTLGVVLGRSTLRVKELTLFNSVGLAHLFIIATFG